MRLRRCGVTARLDRLGAARQAHAHVVAAREGALLRRVAAGDRAMVVRAHPFLVPPMAARMRELTVTLRAESRAALDALNGIERAYLRRALRGAA